jgi:hypothetical protein
MSEGSEVWGGGGRGVGRGAGRGTAEASTGGRETSAGAVELDGFKPSSLEDGDLTGAAEGPGVGVLTGSARSVRLGFGVASSGSVFFFGVSFSDAVFFLGVEDLSASVFELFLVAGTSPLFAFGLGVTSSSSSSAFFADDFVLGFGLGDASSSSSPDGVFLGRGVFVRSGLSVAFGFGFGVGVAFFFAFDFRLAGFGFAVGSGVSDGAGEVTARISSRAFFFFCSSVDSARTKAARMAARLNAVPRKTRSRITGREGNKGGCVINSRNFSKSRGLWDGLGQAGGALAFPP